MQVDDPSDSRFAAALEVFRADVDGVLRWFTEEERYSAGR